MSRKLTAFVLTALIPFALASMPAIADPHGNGNRNGNGKAHQQNHGQKQHGKSQHKENNKAKGNAHTNKGPGNTAATFDQARELAVRYGFTGYSSLPPGIAKNLARGKPLPPGIAKKMVPTNMLNELPHYPGYEWYVVGDDLVLVAVTTLIVNTILQGVFN
ncbi:membrane protein [Pragia fontium]|uniref:Membrane protein n=1 Tax=Pragia fontium TaxID=82985 RepID=A0ABQ5LM85_9GAMM|nr:RcnB family protein [Pragia fontium]GKX63698.1 membrane protein [Pragia fontium]